jgi:hypothetical protein
MACRRRRLVLALVWTLPSALFLAITAIVYSAYRIPPPERLDDATRADVIATLRAALEDKPTTPSPVRARAAGPVALTVWVDGRPRIQINAEAADIGSAVDAIAAKLRAHPTLPMLVPEERERARLQVDVVTGTGPLGRQHWLLGHLEMPGVGDMLAINPGVEGIGVTLHGRTSIVLPHELVAIKGLLAAKRPISAVQELAMGVDLNKIRTLVAQRADAKTGVAVEQLFRFRTDTFVERPLGQRAEPPLPLYRGNPAAPPLTAQLLRELALDGGRYLVAHLAPTPTTWPNAPVGRYIYEHDLASGTMTDPRSAYYSMPRHAGTTYFLAELYRITKEEWLREPIERAFAHLVELMSNGRCARTLPDATEIDCVMDKTEPYAKLGSTALAVVALAEYQRATGDTRYLPLATKLASWILWMQRADGSFRHRYDPGTGQPDDEAQDLYYSGEAALAMARMHVITGEAKYARSAESALDWLVGWYDFFMAGFLYGEEHWTCIAAEAAWPAVQNPAYRDFCHGYGKFLRDQQMRPGEHPDAEDLAGAYGITAFLVPNNTPAGSRTEAMISAYLLGKHHGTPDPAVEGQIRAALQFVVGQQIRPDNAFAVVGPGLGGVPGSPIDRNVRIDYVQHVCSAMIRASEWLDAE